MCPSWLLLRAGACVAESTPGPGDCTGSANQQADTFITRENSSCWQISNDFGEILADSYYSLSASIALRNLDVILNCPQKL